MFTRVGALSGNLKLHLYATVEADVGAERDSCMSACLSVCIGKHSEALSEGAH